MSLGCLSSTAHFKLYFGSQLKPILYWTILLSFELADRTWYGAPYETGARESFEEGQPGVRSPRRKRRRFCWWSDWGSARRVVGGGEAESGFTVETELAVKALAHHANWWKVTESHILGRDGSSVFTP